MKSETIMMPHFKRNSYYKNKKENKYFVLHFYKYLLNYNTKYINIYIIITNIYMFIVLVYVKNIATIVICIGFFFYLKFNCTNYFT